MRAVSDFVVGLSVGILVSCQLFVDVSDRTTGSPAPSNGGKSGSAGSGTAGSHGAGTPAVGGSAGSSAGEAGAPSRGGAAGSPGGEAGEPARGGTHGGGSGGSGGSAGGSGGASGGSSGHAGGTTAGEGGDGAMGGVDSGGSAGESPEPRPPRSVWAGWKMPNPATTGLPNPASYDISEPDVVTDLVTGLMWQREAGPNDHYDAAVSYCDGLTLGGYTDWRLPTRIELVSLLDFTRTAPAFDPVFGSHEGPYLTSSPYPGRTDAVYMIYFGPGYTTIADKAVASPGAVRCVR